MDYTKPISQYVPANWMSMTEDNVSPVFYTYWKFAAERQSVFMKRVRGEAPPWTNDPLLTEFKFTNCYRACDRVSQYLIRNVIYVPDDSKNPALARTPGWDAYETFFRILLFKLFNKNETWELFKRELGEEPSWFNNYNFERYDKILKDAMVRGEIVHGSAYMMSASGGWGQPRHQLYLRLLEKWMADDVPLKMTTCGSMENAFNILLPYKLMGNFLAYQYVTDINYSPLVDWSEMEFTCPGPGAVRGIQKSFNGINWRKEWKYEDVIRFMADTQDFWFQKLGLKFEKLGENPMWRKMGAHTGRPLQLIDCQNLFCETDKYSRHAHPDIKPEIKRRKKRAPRIKAKFAANPKPIPYFFPPKWGISI